MANALNQLEVPNHSPEAIRAPKSCLTAAPVQGERRMAKILVAAAPEPRAVVERILAGHDLTCAETLAHAGQFLQEGTFDLIICTIVFDESKMFDLLRLAKSRAQWQRIPFIGARVRAHILRLPTSLQSAAFTCRALGAEAFLDIADYRVDPEREMRDAIQRFLDTTTPRTFTGDDESGAVGTELR